MYPAVPSGTWNYCPFTRYLQAPHRLSERRQFGGNSDEPLEFDWEVLAQLLENWVIWHSSEIIMVTCSEP